MNLDFEVDFDAQDISLIIDNSISLSAYKEVDDSIIFNKFNRIESLDLQDKLKEICRILFTIDEI